jgi:hypothetical protein
MERKLSDYLPYAVRDFEEYQGITTGEQPEFELAWDSEQEVFDNQFIDTAQDYGLGRWEKMLNIFPKGTDTLDTRRARIKSQLNNFVPYTFRVLAQMITAIANGEPFELSLEPGSYYLTITAHWGVSGQIEGLEYLINNVVPCNIAISSENKLTCSAEGLIPIACGVCAAEFFFITNDWVERPVIRGAAKIGGATPGTETLFLTNDSQEVHTIQATAYQGGGTVDSAKVVITNDFNEQFMINGAGSVKGGIATADFIGVNDK